MRRREHPVLRAMNPWRPVLGLLPPQEENQRLLPLAQRPDHRGRERLPPLAPVRARQADLDGQCSIQQQHPLFRPATEHPLPGLNPGPAGWRRHVVCKLLQHVSERRGVRLAPLH